MTPFPTPEELAVQQQECRDAWEAAKLLIGIEKMKMIHKAFPFAVAGGGAESSLHFDWHPEHKWFCVCDYGGFITLIPEDDLETLAAAIKLEFQQFGAFRETITGQKARPVSRRQPVKKIKRTSLSLKDLGL